jgi:hypothetical protein
MNTVKPLRAWRETVGSTPGETAAIGSTDTILLKQSDGWAARRVVP